MFQLNLPMSPILQKHRCVFQRSLLNQKYDIERSAPNSSLQTKTRNALHHLHLSVTMASSKLSIQISWAMTGELLDTIVVRADETVGKLKEKQSLISLPGSRYVLRIRDYIYNPYHPCMVYSPTFTTKINQM